MQAFVKNCIAFAALLTLSCSAASLPQVAPKESICKKRPEIFTNSKSHICDVTLALGTTPEQLDIYLLDTSAMAYVTKKIDSKKITRFLDRMETKLQPLCINMTYNDVLENLDEEAKRSTLIKQVINRRLRFYGSPEPISDMDCWMILQGIEHQREQFGLSFKKME